MQSFVLTAPMLISTTKGEPYYILPSSTALSYEAAYAEGHQRYTLSLYAKGKLPLRSVEVGEKVESTWLYPIDKDNVGKLMSEYPLSKDDLAKIVGAHKMTRDEVTQIVRDCPPGGVAEN